LTTDEAEHQPTPELSFEGRVAPNLHALRCGETARTVRHTGFNLDKFFGHPDHYNFKRTVLQGEHRAQKSSNVEYIEGRIRAIFGGMVGAFLHASLRAIAHLGSRDLVLNLRWK
jgi:hypothetical protein